MPLAREHAKDTAIARSSVVVGFVALFAAFFWTPLLRYGEVHYSTADLTQEFSLTNVEPLHTAKNRLLSDPVVQMQPWLAFNRSELASGRVPLWNPYNGCGAPQLANHQSAVFSPFSAPFYVLSDRAALLVSAAAKLAALALFTFLFLRAVGLDRAPSLIGATAFAFAGHNVLLLAYPHPAAAMVLPASLYFVERACGAAATAARDGAAQPARSALPYVAGLALALAASVLAGHPEPLFFGAITAALYALFRTGRLRRELGEGARPLVRSLRLHFASAALIAVGGTAFQTAPFLEYLRNSTILAERLQGAQGLPLSNWPLWFFPNALGNPTLRYWLDPTIPEPNFEAANTVYIGGIALFAALLALWFVRRDARLAFFAVLAAVWFVCVYDVFGAQTLVAWIPGATLAPLNRSQIVWLFALSVGLAFAAQHLRPAVRGARAAPAIAVAVLAVAVLAIGLLGADALIHRTMAERELEPRDYARYVPQHFAFIEASFSLGALALVALAALERPAFRLAAHAALLASVFLSSGFLLRDYNTCCDDAHYFPTPPQLSTLRERVGEGRLLVLGEDTLPPDSNVAYRVAMATSYDTLWIARYDRLFRREFAASDNWRNTLVASEHALKLFGIDHVLSLGDWLPIDGGGPRDWPSEHPEWIAQPVDMESGELVRFTSESDGLQAAAIWLGVRPGRPKSVVRIGVRAASGATLCEETLDSDSFLRDIRGPVRTVFPSDLRLDLPSRAVVLRFPPIERSAGESYSLYVAPVEGGEHGTWNAWTMKGASPERVLFDTSTRLDRFEPLDSLGWFRLWRYAQSPGRAWLVHGVRRADGPEMAFARTTARDWDPAASVVLEGDVRERAAPSPPPTEPRPEVIDETPQRIRWRVRSADEGHLVLAQAWFPGWRARVDGRTTPVMHANFAFAAIAISAGEHEVVYEYAPASFRIGLALAAATVAISAALAWRAHSRRSGILP
jgi:hypothetical protein